MKNHLHIKRQAQGEQGFAIVIVAAGWVAHVQANRKGDTPPHDSGTEIDRLRFLATATVLLAALSFIGVVFTAMPVIFLTDCR